MIAPFLNILILIDTVITLAGRREDDIDWDNLSIWRVAVLSKMRRSKCHLPIHIAKVSPPPSWPASHLAWLGFLLEALIATLRGCLGWCWWWRANQAIRMFWKLINLIGHVWISEFQICVTALSPKTIDVLFNKFSPYEFCDFFFLDEIHSNVNLSKITRGQATVYVIPSEFNLGGCHYHLFHNIVVSWSIFNMHFKISFSKKLKLYPSLLIYFWILQYFVRHLLLHLLFPEDKNLLYLLWPLFPDALNDFVIICEIDSVFLPSPNFITIGVQIRLLSG